MWWRWMAVFILAACATGHNIKQRHPYRCNMFYSLESCGPGLQFNDVTAKCDTPIRAKCENNLRKVNAPKKPQRMVLAYAHPASCELYYRLNFCPRGLHFSPEISDCVFPQYANCISECPALVAEKGMIITPATCTSGDNKAGASCSFNCTKGYHLKGSESMVCTEVDWESDQGLGIFPSCLTNEDIAVQVKNDTENEMRGVDADLLFVMDESWSITKEKFPKEVHFVKALVSAFPLSSHRCAGAVLFDDKVRVPITLKTNDTCTFLKKADKIIYHNGATNILLALKTANEEIRRNGIHKKTLVFLITDGLKSLDPTPEANILKNNGNVLFTIGIAYFDRKLLESLASNGQHGEKLFYGVTDFDSFDEVARILETKYSNAKYNCP